MNKRIIIIDDTVEMHHSYRSILAPGSMGLDELAETAAMVERNVFGGSPGRSSRYEEDYELAYALQGEEGYQKVQRAVREGKPFSVAFLDVRMSPGWDGVYTAKMIRAVDPLIEIVIVTAYTDRDRTEILDSVGMPERLLYVKKPFDPDEIRQLAMSLTRKWDLERKAERVRSWLEALLQAVRRLKAQAFSSFTDLCHAILREILEFVPANKGVIAQMEGNEFQAVLAWHGFTADEVRPFLNLLSQDVQDMKTLTSFGVIQVMPLKVKFGRLYVMIANLVKPLGEEKTELLRLFIEAASDILETQKKQEQYLQNERIATIGQIAAGIIHEINNPLAGIVGASDAINHQLNRLLQLVDQTVATPDGGHRVAEAVRVQLSDLRDRILRQHNIIRSGTDRIFALMDRIRSFSRSSDRFEPRLNNIADALEDTLILADTALKGRVEVHRLWASDLTALCDLDKLKQVFLNLVINAAQAIDGPGQLWIKGARLDGQVVLSFKDTGKGMSEELLRHVFDPFFTTKVDGTGLGLSIVKALVERHGGSVAVQSDPGRGTEFNLTLPAG